MDVCRAKKRLPLREDSTDLDLSGEKIFAVEDLIEDRHRHPSIMEQENLPELFNGYERF